MIDHILAEEGVPPELKYLAMVESGLNPQARSWAGAVGMWQFMASTGRRYGVARVCEEWEIARSTYYDAVGRRQEPARPRRKPGPKTAWSDEQLTEEVRRTIERSPFVGEGYRKVWARLRAEGIRTSKARVLRLMREAGLLATQRGERVRGPKVHDGTIVTERPDVMWGTDATATYTRSDGWVTVFAAVDHATAECVGIHAAKPGTRFEALVPVHQAVRERFGAFGRGAASGLKLRHDHGSQYTSDHFQAELGFLGIEPSPSYVRAPEGNGCIERFFRTLKEQLLWIEPFEDVEQLRQRLREWAQVYNESWLLQRHDHQTPSAVRERLTDTASAA
jgi:transposase InsO family protein